MNIATSTLNIATSALLKVLESNFFSGTFGIIIAVFVVGWFGFNQYSRQKIREEINKRYFENGLENLIAYLDRIRLTVEDNYGDALKTLQHFRDLEKKDFVIWLNIYKKGYKKVSPSIPTSFLITKSLFDNYDNNEYFEKICINIFINCTAINDYFIAEITGEIARYIEGPDIERNMRRDLASRLENKVVQEFEKTFKENSIYKLRANLENILFELRKMKINSYEKLKKAKNSEAVKQFLLKVKSLNKK